MTDGDRIDIRALTCEDAAAFRALRIAGLTESPDAFTASLEEEQAISDEEMADRAVPPPPGVFFGAFAGGDHLVGMAGYIANDRPKTRHKGMMVAVYVAPQWRAAGVGRGLVDAVIEHAASLRAILHCTVRADNHPARSLYLHLGFRPYGLERNAIRVGDVFHDDELLALDLRGGRVRS